jgi:hypothetical protein
LGQERKALVVAGNVCFTPESSHCFAIAAKVHIPPMLLKKSLLRRGKSFDSLDK